MSSKTVKGVVWLAVAIAVAMIIATASPAFGRNQSLVLFLGACGVLVAAVLWYYRAIPGAEARDAEDHAAQAALLKQEISTTCQPKSVKASSGILLFVLMVAITIWFGYPLATAETGSMGMFVLSLVLTTFLGLFSLPLVGKPALIIRRDGIETPLLGFLSWEAIESVALRAYSNKGITSHVIHLHVPRLGNVRAHSTDCEARSNSAFQTT